MYKYYVYVTSLFIFLMFIIYIIHIKTLTTSTFVWCKGGLKFETNKTNETLINLFNNDTTKRILYNITK